MVGCALAKHRRQRGRKNDHRDVELAHDVPRESSGRTRRADAPSKRKERVAREDERDLQDNTPGDF